MRTLYPEIALAACVFVAVALRYLVVGERFDRAVHGVDPRYRNLREIARRLLANPIDGAKDLPRAYWQYSGHLFRAVEDPDVEKLRRRAVRAFVDVAILGWGGVVVVFVIGALLRRVSASLHDTVAIAASALLLVYWAASLTRHFRGPDSSTMSTIYMLGGIAAAVAAIVLIAQMSSRAF